MAWAVVRPKAKPTAAPIAPVSITCKGPAMNSTLARRAILLKDISSQGKEQEYYADIGQLLDALWALD
jgi:hypothetical protein